MNPSPDPEAELESLLRQASTPLPDDGFSARVMAALPAAPRPSRSRFWLCVAGAAAGCAVAGAGGASWTGVAESLVEIQRSLAALATLAVDPGFVVAVLIVAFAMVYALRRNAPDSPLV